MSTDDQSQTACGFVAVIGAPNAGKSTLVNRIVGAKVSIVSHKVQTTRFRIRGIAMADTAQVVFVDTPGIFAPKRRLDRAMVRAAWDGVAEADLILLLVDAQRGLTEDVTAIIDRLKDTRTLEDPIPIHVALNKVDMVRRESLLALADALNNALAPDQIYMISALKGDGCDDVLDRLGAVMPPGPWMFPEDDLSDLPMRLLAAEITREKVFLNLHEELPYSATVTTDRWDERKDGSVRIEQTIHVARDSQKPIVLGKGGTRIKSLGRQAREELGALLEREVHLFLHVTVRENLWDSRDSYADWGLDYDA
ncbi:MAG: GTPase Era [Rhodospirillaceae bacterium]